ncbi:MarR family winged helix-turn-helix transcriptional regulator [Selenomonas sp.]|uniref:MarR family winged helix-turn-helix transcriptional regulator n=2 Tax=Selenomonas sp. TaxID=2053611 RepID=UPI003FA32781
MRPGDMGTSIALLYRYSQSYFNEEMKKYGLGNGQYVFLLYLLDHEGINQETLAHMVKIDKTTAARAVARLVEAGYVKRTVSDSDRRAYVLTTTKKSQGIKKELRKTMAAWQEMVETGFTPEECRQFGHLLDHAVENVVMQGV